MTPNDFEIGTIVEEVVEIYEDLHRGERSPALKPAITSISQVTDKPTGLLFAIHQIGVALNALGGAGLAHRVILAVEERLDDVNAAVFLNRRWDGFPRS